jgi:outer membrane lipoprotein-sorting protein
MKIFKLILIIYVFSINTIFSQNKTFIKVANLEALKSKITTFAQKTNSINSDFIQEKHLEILDEPLISKGKFYYKKENNIRWEYTEPLKYIIAIHDNKFTIKDETKISSYDIKSNKMFKEINNMIISSMKGEIINNKDFSSSFFENNTFYLAEMTPLKKEMKDFLQTIKIYFDKTDFSVSKVIMTENKTDYTKITFSDKKINTLINDNIFILKK